MKSEESNLFLKIDTKRERLVSVRGYFLLFDEEGEYYEGATCDQLYVEGANFMLTAVRFEFDNETVIINVQGDDDSLEIFGAEWICPDKEALLCDLSSVAPWNTVIGKPLMWSWDMVNQNNYRDAIQLYFAKDVSDEEVILQFVGMASQIDIYTLSRLSPLRLTKQKI